MTSRSRGRGQRGRGRANLYYTEFPTLNSQTSNSSASSSQPTVKDVLLLPEQYIPNINVDETVLFIEQNDEKWMKDPWEIKRRYLTTQQSPPRFNQY